MNFYGLLTRIDIEGIAKKLLFQQENKRIQIVWIREARIDLEGGGITKLGIDDRDWNRKKIVKHLPIEQTK